MSTEGMHKPECVCKQCLEWKGDDWVDPAFPAKPKLVTADNTPMEAMKDYEQG